MLCNAVVVVVVAVRLSMYLSTYLSICKLENEAILQDFLNVLTWRHRKRSKSARFPQCFTLTTSATKQFCDTSSSFEVDNIKNYEILRDFLQKWKVACGADGLVPMRFAIFPFHLSKVLRLLRKSEARSYEVLRLSRKIILANLKIWCSKMQPLSGNQRPDLLTSDEHVFCTAPATRNASLLLRILTSKCASCHNGAQFFISHMTTWLRTRRFSEPTFRPPEPQIIGKTPSFACFVTFLPFGAPASSFFSLFLFSDLLSSALLLSDSCHLCFSIVVGSLTSKLPSDITPRCLLGFGPGP